MLEKSTSTIVPGTIRAIELARSLYGRGLHREACRVYELLDIILKEAGSRFPFDVDDTVPEALEILLRRILAKENFIKEQYLQQIRPLKNFLGYFKPNTPLGRQLYYSLS